MTARNVVLIALILLGCESRGTHGKYSTTIPLWEIVPIKAEPKWTRDEILYSNEFDWPVLPLVNGIWCGTSTIYWSYGLEAEFEKDALSLLVDENKNWHLWFYTHNFPLGNGPPGMVDISEASSKIHCILDSKIHVIKIPVWLEYEYKTFEKHYNGICQEMGNLNGSTYETPPQKCMIKLLAFQGRVTVHIEREMAYRKNKEDNFWRVRVLGITSEPLGRCEGINTPPIGSAVEEDRARIERWANSFIGQDGKNDIH